MKICFIGFNNYPVLNPAYGESTTGGASVQQVLLARALAERGHSVSMIVADRGQPDDEVIDGIRVLKWVRPEGGLPVLRFIHPRLTRLFAAMAEADADIYYHSAASAMTGLAVWFCKRHNKRFVFRVASDTDCIPEELKIRFWRDRKLYEYGLRQADAVLAQNETQVALLRDNYGLSGVQVNQLVEDPGEVAGVEKDIDVLWVGFYRSCKRPEVMADLARLLPDLKLVMVGGFKGNPEEVAGVERRAEGCANLERAGYVPYKEIGDYFSRSKVLVNTSLLEGFPNTFLQAWIRGVPVASFFDPGGLIVREGLGVVVSDLEEMAKRIQGLVSGVDTGMSQRVRRYAFENHAPEGVAPRYERLFERLLQGAANLEL